MKQIISKPVFGVVCALIAWIIWSRASIILAIIGLLLLVASLVWTIKCAGKKSTVWIAAHLVLWLVCSWVFSPRTVFAFKIARTYNNIAALLIAIPIVIFILFRLGFFGSPKKNVSMKTYEEDDDNDNNEYYQFPQHIRSNVRGEYQIFDLYSTDGNTHGNYVSRDGSSTLKLTYQEVINGYDIVG